MYSQWLAMEIKGKRVSQNGKIHIFEASPTKATWDSYCGKRITSKHSFPLEPVDEKSCCAMCWNLYHRNMQAKAKLNPKG